MSLLTPAVNSVLHSLLFREYHFLGTPEAHAAPLNPSLSENASDQRLLETKASSLQLPSISAQLPWFSH